MRGNFDRKGYNITGFGFKEKHAIDYPSIKKSEGYSKEINVPI